MQILTPSGFQPFDGVKRYWHEESLEFLFSDGTRIRTSFKHKFIVDNKVKYADELFEGYCLAEGKRVDRINVIKNGEYFYDPVNVSNGSIFYHDYGLTSHNTFFGTGDTLIGAEALLAQKAEQPIQMLEDNSVNIYKKPVKDHQYVMLVDVSKGRGQDYSTFNIIDITERPFKQVATYRNNKISPILFPNVIHKYAKVYNEAYVIVEANDQGGLVTHGLYYELEYEHIHMESLIKADRIGVEMNKKIKRIGCSAIKDLIETNKIHIVDAQTILEMSTFVAKGSSFEASDGNHDDLMMNLVLFGYFAVSNSFEQLTEMSLKDMMFQQRMKEIEDDVLPFGFIDDGMDNITSPMELQNEDDPWVVADEFNNSHLNFRIL